MQSDTPRTDAKEWDAGCWHVRRQSVVDADFARKLERELAAVRQQRDEAVNALKRIAHYDYRGNRSGESQIAMDALIAMRTEGGRP